MSTLIVTVNDLEALDETTREAVGEWAGRAGIPLASRVEFDPESGVAARAYVAVLDGDGAPTLVPNADEDGSRLAREWRDLPADGEPIPSDALAAVVAHIG
jgi:hypothetical protein